VHSGRDAFSLSHHRHVGPACQVYPLPHTGRPLSFLLVVSTTPSRPASPSDATQAITRPAIISPLPPLIPLLTSPPSSMVLKPLTLPLLAPGHPSLVPPSPYKRAMRPPLSLTAPHALSYELFHTLLRPHDELKPPLFIASGAPPRCHNSVTGEHLPSTTSTGSFSPSVTGEH
jgi:hypothetical protein